MVWLLPRVAHHVCVELGRAGEGPLAHRTLEAAPGGVSMGVSHVLLEGMRTVIQFVAHPAREPLARTGRFA